MISYVEVVINKWDDFKQFIRCAAYKPKDVHISLFWELLWSQLDFWVTMTIKFEFEFEIFSIGKGPPRI